MLRSLTAALLASAAALASLPAAAGQLAYSPSFSSPGSPYFYQSMSRQGDFSRPVDPKIESSSLTKRSLAQTIQDSVALSIATEIQQEVLSNSATSGSFNLGDGSSISYTTQGGIRYITFTTLEGTTTLSIPL